MKRPPAAAALSVNAEPAIPPPMDANYPKSGRYQAAQSSKTRPTTRISLRGEDDHLPQRDRDTAHTAVMDEARNYATLGWAIRKHLDFVAAHSFAAATGDKTLDDDLEGLIAEWSEKENYDVRERFDLEDHVRLCEACRTTGGDIFLQKLSDGRIQTIEADRVRDPDQKFSDRWRNGVLQNVAGKNTHFAIHRRDEGGFKFETILPAEEIIHFGYFQRFDQARGISPILAGLNDYRDTAGAKTYALAKMKIQQLFGAVVNVEDPQSSEINLSGGPFVAEIGIDEKMQFLNDNTPSSNFDSFMRHAIAIALKAIDIPYSFYDEAYTNFFGSRAALNLYLMSAEHKRRSVRSMRRHLIRWRLNFEVASGRLRLPRSIDGVNALRFDLIPAGFPWWNPQQEATAAQTLLALRLRTRSELRKETHGDNWFDVVDKLAAEDAHLRANGFDVDPATTGQAGQAGQDPDTETRIAELERLVAEIYLHKRE